MSWPDRLFRLITRLLPAEFRGDYGRELEATFLAARREATGPRARLQIWASTLVDVVRTAPAEHLDILRRDLGYTARMFVRRPALTLTATLTLALGIGANTAIFSVVDGVLLAPLPYADADRLVLVEEDEADDEPGTTGFASFDAIRAEQQTLDGLVAMSGWSAILAGDGRDAERVAGARVSWNFFRTLGVRPALGRDFDPSEDHPERRRVVLISDSLWRRRFQADPSIVGRPMTINQVTYLLAGVMPASFSELVTERKFGGGDVWSLLGYSIELPQACRSCRHIHLVGRLRSGVTLEQAEADLSRTYQRLSTQFPADYTASRAAITPMRDYFLGPVQRPLLLLWGAVGLLLVMACANIANLLLIRASEREEEMAIRRALGISTPRLLRQLITEAITLAMMGGVAGAVLAWWSTTALTTHGPEGIPRLQDVAVNSRVLIYALGVSLLTGLVFGLAPARVLITRTGGDGRLAGRRVTAGPGAWRHRAWLVGVNVALSVVLLVGSGLLVRSFVRLLSVAPGFDPSGILTLQADLSGAQFSTVAGVTRFYDELTARLSRLPGAAVVTAATQIPLTGSIDRSGITLEGRERQAHPESLEADRYAVRPGFFAAMSIPLVRGRLFGDADAGGATPVVIVSRAMADAAWPGEDPIGRRIRVAGGPGNPMRTVVGVVGDVRHYGFHLPVTPQVYIPHAQALYPEPMVTVLVRMRHGQDPLSIASAVRAEMRALDPLQVVSRLRSYDTIVGASMATRRFTLLLLAIFAATALILALVGLYGALSYVVTQRQCELGVRAAMGATARDILRLVVRQGMAPVGGGLAAGLAISVAAGRGLESLLFGVTPRDAVTFAAVGVVIALSGLVACILPARRASRIEPAVTLRAQ